MSAALEKSLDEIIGEKKPERHERRGDTRRRPAPYSRDRRPPDRPRYDREDDRRRWDHDRYSPRLGRRDDRTSRRSVSRERTATLRVSNVHYELSESELRELFDRIGPISRFHLKTDRSGRSDGMCYVTYDDHRDARRAITEYDGQKALGLKLVVEYDDRADNHANGRDLASRISKGPYEGNDSRPIRSSGRGRGRGREARNSTAPTRRGPVSAADLDAELDSFMSQRTEAADQPVQPVAAENGDGMQID